MMLGKGSPIDLKYTKGLTKMDKALPWIWFWIGIGVGGLTILLTASFNYENNNNNIFNNWECTKTAKSSEIFNGKHVIVEECLEYRKIRE